MQYENLLPIDCSQWCRRLEIDLDIDITMPGFGIDGAGD